VRVVIAGGGTAGHVYPGIALARLLSKHGSEATFIGRPDGVEARLVTAAGYEFVPIQVAGRDRGFSFKNVVVAAKLLSAIWRCLTILARSEPDVVVGTGGYVSLPVILAARIHRIPVVIHEQNAVPGLANRIGARFAAAVAVSFPTTQRRLRERVFVTGNPVRPEIAHLDLAVARDAGLQEFDLEAGRRTLLVAGGSQGALAVNEAAFGCYRRWRADERLQVLHLVGPGNLEASERFLAGLKSPEDRIEWRLVAYTERMDLALAVADLAVSRAGATTLAEMCAAGLPAVLVPYPYSLDDDQLHNARALADAGGAEVIVQAGLSPEELAAAVEALIYDDDRLARMGEAMKTWARPEAAERLLELVFSVAQADTRRSSRVAESSPPVEAREKPGGHTVSLPGWEAPWRRCHLVGAGGAGMSAIGHVLLQAGLTVTGSDRSESTTLSSLADAGAEVSVGHAEGRATKADVVVASSAIPSDNVELMEAKKSGVPVIDRGEAVARLMTGRRTIAISGTHGKTSTAAMTASILEREGADPTYVVGASLAGHRAGGRLGRGEWGVVEADEAFGSFLLLDPAVALVTNVDADHLDFYGGMDGLLEAFRRFASRATQCVVYCVDDPRAGEVAGSAEVPSVSYGLSAEAEVRAEAVEWDAQGSRFDLLVRGEAVGRATIALGGPHYVQNALGAAAAAIAAGVDPEGAIRGLSAFKGVSRRFERKGTLNGADLVDDYGHHPREIEAALQVAGKGAYRRVVAVFQPHLFSRTMALSRELGSSLTSADVVVVTDIDGAREEPVPGVSGKWVADAVCEAAPGKRVVYLPELAEAASFVEQEAKPGDLVITLGCGYVTKFHDLIGRS